MFESSAKAVTASEAKVHFGDILNQCVSGRQCVVIKKHGKPVAVLLRFEDWQDSMGVKLIDRIKQLRAEIAAYQKKHCLTPSPSAVDIIRELRAKREERLFTSAKLPSKKQSRKRA